MTNVLWLDDSPVGPKGQATIYTTETSEEYRGYKLTMSDDHGRLIDITKDGTPVEGLGRFTKFTLARAAINKLIEDVTNEALPEVQAN